MLVVCILLLPWSYTLPNGAFHSEVIDWTFEVCTGSLSATPLRVPTHYSATLISASPSASFAPVTNAYTASWGSYFQGLLGTGASSEQLSPVDLVWSIAPFPLGGLAKTSRIGYAFHSLGVTYNGDVYGWGANSFGQLGNGGTTQQDYPVAVVWTTPSQPTGGCQEVAGGSAHSCAVCGGDAYCWGRNIVGEVGDNTVSQRTNPVLALFSVNGYAGVGVTSIVCGDSHTAALGNDGYVYVWGYGASGALGDGGSSNSYAPKRPVWSSPSFPGSLAGVATGAQHVIVVGGDTNMYGWGDNQYGQLGLGTTTPKEVNPKAVVWSSPAAPGGGVVKVFTGYMFSLCIGADTKIYTWGRNDNGELGLGTYPTTQVNPAEVVFTSPSFPAGGFSDAAAGQYHVLALAADGTLWAWGYNNHGQLGDGSMVTSANPILVPGLNLPLLSFGTVADASFYSYTAPSTSVTPTPSESESPTASPSTTPSPTASVTPSESPTPSVTPSESPTASVTPSETPTASVTPSLSPTSSVTPSITPSASESASISTSPAPSMSSRAASVTPSESESPSLSPSNSVSSTTIPFPSSTGAPVCSPVCLNGTCVVNGTSATCFCYPHFTGAACDQYTPLTISACMGGCTQPLAGLTLVTLHGIGLFGPASKRGAGMTNGGSDVSVSVNGVDANDTMGNIAGDSVSFTAPSSAVEGYALLAITDLVNGNTLVRNDVVYYARSCLAPGEALVAGQCVPCPTGAVCPGGGRMWPIPGYWSVNENTKPEQCAIDWACPGASDDSKAAVNGDGTRVTNVCAADQGYTGAYCASCLTDFYRDNARCRRCGDDITGTKHTVDFPVLVAALAVFVLLLCLGVIFLHYTRLNALVGTIVIFQQIIYVGRNASKYIKGEAGEKASDAFRNMSILMLDVEFIRPACNLPHVTFAAIFWGTLVGFVCAAILMLVASALHGLFVRRQCCRSAVKAAESRRESLRFYFTSRGGYAIIVAAALIYLQLTIRVFQAIHCTSERLLVIELSSICYTGPLAGVGAVAWVLLFAFCIGFPVALVVVLWKAHRGDKLNSFMENMLGYVTKGVRKEWFWFRAASFANAFILAANSVFVRPQGAQILASCTSFAFSYVLGGILWPFQSLLDNIITLVVGLANILQIIVFLHQLGETTLQWVAVALLIFFTIIIVILRARQFRKYRKDGGKFHCGLLQGACCKSKDGTSSPDADTGDASSLSSSSVASSSVSSFSDLSSLTATRASLVAAGPEYPLSDMGIHVLSMNPPSSADATSYLSVRSVMSAVSARTDETTATSASYNSSKDGRYGRRYHAAFRWHWPGEWGEY